MSFQEFADAHTPRHHSGRVSKPVLVGAAVIVVIVMGAIAWSLSSSSHGISIEKAEASVEAAAQTEEQPVSEVVYVHVAGSVMRPGICKLEAGARVAQAIEAAGGFSEDAATESVNLARTVEDGEQIVVASTDALASAGEAGGMPGVQADTATAPQASAASESKVNINTASEAELQTITGIGPSKAAKIIAYRESNGMFKTVDDLINVSGIGQKTLESIRDQVCVG